MTALQTMTGRTLAVLLTAAIGVQLAWWGWHFFAPAPSLVAPQPVPVDLGLAAGLFGDAPREPAGDTAPSPVEERTADDLRLKGVFAVDGKTLSAAVVHLGGRDVSVRLRESLGDGYVLSEVHADHIVVSRKGAKRRIDLDRPAAKMAASAAATAASGSPGAFRLNVVNAGPNNFSLSRGELNNVLQDARQVGMLGRIGAGPTGGVQVQDAAAGTLAQKLGLQSGDIITQINGQPVQSAGDLARIYGQFSSLSSIRAEVKRNGVPMAMTYTINP